MYECKRSTICQLIPNCIKYQLEVGDRILVTKKTKTVVLAKFQYGLMVYRFKINRKQLDDNFKMVEK